MWEVVGESFPPLPHPSPFVLDRQAANNGQQTAASEQVPSGLSLFLSSCSNERTSQRRPTEGEVEKVSSKTRRGTEMSVRASENWLCKLFPRRIYAENEMKLEEDDSGLGIDRRKHVLARS